jgi:hypothetical protein
VENRRWLVQASNAGGSFVVSPSGEVTARTSFLARTILQARVATSRERSLYSRFGDVPLLLVVVALGVWAAVVAWRGRHVPASPPGVGWAPIGVGIALALVAGIGLGVGSVAVIGMQAGARDTSWLSVARDFVTPRAVQVDALSTSGSGEAGGPSGAAALGFALHVLGIEGEPAPATAGTSADGSVDWAPTDLVHAARESGLRSWTERPSFATLQAAPKPVIARLVDRYVVILHSVDADVELFDPIGGLRRIPADRLRETWTGEVVQLRFRPLEATVPEEGHARS